MLMFEFWAEAAADASKAIEIDPSMAKAYLRKGCVYILYYTWLEFNTYDLIQNYKSFAIGS